MTVRLPEADEFEALRRKHDHEWPQDVKDAAERVQLSLNVGNGKGFKQSVAMQQGLAEDFADFRRKEEAWRQSRA